MSEEPWLGGGEGVDGSDCREEEEGAVAKAKEREGGTNRAVEIGRIAV